MFATTIEEATTMTTTMTHTLHLIDTDARGEAAGTGRVLSVHATHAEATRAARHYLADHPGAWLQIEEPGRDGGTAITDVRED